MKTQGPRIAIGPPADNKESSMSHYSGGEDISVAFILLNGGDNVIDLALSNYIYLGEGDHEHLPPPLMVATEVDP